MAYTKNKSAQRESRVLVIDNEVSIRLLLKKILVNQNYKVIAVQTGIEGIELMEEYDFRMVFLDLCLPYVNGAEILRRIMVIYPRVPVVIMTGNPESDVMKQALDYKPFDVLNKPIDDVEVMRIMNKVKKMQKL